MTVADVLAEYLADVGDATVAELVGAVRRSGGHGVSRAAVERALRGDRRFAVDVTATKPRWVLAAGGSDGNVDTDVHTDSDGDGRGRGGLDALALRDWQAEALAAWSRTCRGVVEAVTGTGKTRLAVAVISQVLRRGGRALVLVPTLELLEQWEREVRELLPGRSVGRLGGGGDGDLFAHEVLVATPNSAADPPVDLPPGVAGLLVADEAHRYGAPTWGAALSEEFTLRIALTATYERGDDGVADVLAPYFGDVVYRYGYDRAVADGVVAPFAIALAGVELGAADRESYAAADRAARRLRRELITGLGLPREPRALTAAAAGIVADAHARGRDGPGVRACAEYLARLRQRREVAARAPEKLELLAAAAPGLQGRRSLVFTDTVTQAQDAAARLSSNGVRAEVVHGELDQRRRRIRIAQFRRGRIDALVAPRVLDEGVDVPDAEVAVVLAAFRTRRQMIQRLGRVLRLKPGGASARLVVVYARDTAEDPEHGGHAAFLAEVRRVATAVEEFPPGSGASSLQAWLAG